MLLFLTRCALVWACFTGVALSGRRPDHRPFAGFLCFLLAADFVRAGVAAVAPIRPLDAPPFTGAARLAFHIDEAIGLAAPAALAALVVVLFGPGRRAAWLVGGVWAFLVGFLATNYPAVRGEALRGVYLAVELAVLTGAGGSIVSWTWRRTPPTPAHLGALLVVLVDCVSVVGGAQRWGFWSRQDLDQIAALLLNVTLSIYQGILMDIFALALILGVLSVVVASAAIGVSWTVRAGLARERHASDAAARKLDELSGRTDRLIGRMDGATTEHATTRSEVAGCRGEVALLDKHSAVALANVTALLEGIRGELNTARQQLSVIGEEASAAARTARQALIASSAGLLTGGSGAFIEAPESAASAQRNAMPPPPPVPADDDGPDTLFMESARSGITGPASVTKVSSSLKPPHRPPRPIGRSRTTEGTDG